MDNPLFKSKKNSSKSRCEKQGIRFAHKKNNLVALPPDPRDVWKRDSCNPLRTPRDRPEKPLEPRNGRFPGKLPLTPENRSEGSERLFLGCRFFFCFRKRNSTFRSLADNCWTKKKISIISSSLISLLRPLCWIEDCNREGSPSKSHDVWMRAYTLQATSRAPNPFFKHLGGLGAEPHFAQAFGECISAHIEISMIIEIWKLEFASLTNNCNF